MDAKEYTFNLQIDNNHFSSILEESSNLLKYIQPNELAKLKDFIFDILGNKDGSPEINNLKISNFIFDNVKNKGSFRLKFDIDRRFCCSDMESCSNDYIDFNFKFENGAFNAKGSYFDWTLSN